MNTAHVVLEVEGIGELTLVGVKLLLRNPFCVNRGILVQVNNWMFTKGLAIESVGACLVNAKPSPFSLAWDLSLLYQRFHQVLDRSRLGDEQVIGILINNQSESTEISSQHTSLVIPSLSRVTLILFLVSSSVKLISRTSK